GDRRPHATDQLPPADLDRHHDLLRLGLRVVGQGGPCARPAAGGGDFFPRAGTSQQMVAGAIPDWPDGVVVATTHLWPVDAQVHSCPRRSSAGLSEDVLAICARHWQAAAPLPTTTTRGQHEKTGSG